MEGRPLALMSGAPLPDYFDSHKIYYGIFFTFPSGISDCQAISVAMALPASCPALVAGCASTRTTWMARSKARLRVSSTRYARP
jgi:hypothetical protein